MSYACWVVTEQTLSHIILTKCSVYKCMLLKKYAIRNLIKQMGTNSTIFILPTFSLGLLLKGKVTDLSVIARREPFLLGHKKMFNTADGK